MKKICKMRYFVSFAICLTLLILAYGIIRFHYNSLTVSNTIPVKFEDWKVIFDDESCKDLVLPATINVKANEKVVLSNYISEQIAGQTIAFRTVNQNVNVKLDGESIYNYRQDTAGKFVDSPGNLWHFVTVPEHYEQGELTIELDSPYRNLGGRVTEIVWGARSSCILNFMYSEWVHVFCGFALFIIGLVFVVFYYVLGHLKMQNSGVFYFSISAIFLSMHIVILSGMLQIFYGNAVVYYIVSLATIYFAFIPYLVFLSRSLFKKERKLLTAISSCYLSLYIVILLLQSFGVCDMALFYVPIWIVNIAILITLCVCIIRRIYLKQSELIHYVMFFLFACEVIFIILDYLYYRIDCVGFRHYGLIALLLIPAGYYIYKVVHQYRLDSEEKIQLNNSAMQSLVESQAKMSREIENLIQAKENAQDMNSMKSIFLENVAEKLLMPMNRIIGLDELLLRDDISDNAKDLAGNLQSEASVMLTLINNIMDYSKVENGHMEIKPVAYHVETLLYDMCEIVSLGIIDKDINFIVDFSPNIPRELLGDEIRLRQILTNILNNATHYTNEGVIRFKVDSKLNYADEVLLTIVISDTGIGIEESQLHRLFENFLMSDVNSLAEHKGTGLGLAVCKQLLELMSGSINVESTVGEGSVFTITIPQKIVNGMPLVQAERSEYKVLIFETNKLQRMMMKKTCMDIEVQADFIYDETEFKESILSNVYRTVIITEEEYLKYREYLDSDVCAGIRKVVLVDVAASVASYENAELLQRPVNCMNLYDAISGNDIAKPIAAKYTQNFIAPYAKVLIVDDNPSNLKILMAMMEPYKMQITTSVSGRESIEILKKQKDFDLVFMDYSMPEMSGIEVLSEIRELDDKYYKTLPIIAMPAQKINGAKELFVSEGFDNYIDKPFEVIHLEKILEAYIDEEKLFRSENVNDASISDNEYVDGFSEV